MSSTPPSRFDGQSNTIVIFDMDGTLTRAQLDFDQIRRDIGLPIGPQHDPILESVLQMSPIDRAHAEDVLHRHETVAAESSELQAGAADVIQVLRCRGTPLALMTRNSRRSVETFLSRHGLVFDHIRTREDGEIKPSPVPVLEICATMGRSPNDAWVVGDFHFDIICGRDAGATTVLLWDQPGPPPVWAAEADHVIHSLYELPPCMGLVPLGQDRQ